MAEHRMLHAHLYDNLAFLFTTTYTKPHDGLTREITVTNNFGRRAQISVEIKKKKYVAKFGGYTLLNQNSGTNQF